MTASCAAAAVAKPCSGLSLLLWGALSAPIYLTNLIFLHNFLYGFHVITCSRPPVGGLGKFSAVWPVKSCSRYKFVTDAHTLTHTHTYVAYTMQTQTHLLTGAFN